jgi:phospholipid/cholesterol/gamma-HCH transport system permease protein
MKGEARRLENIADRFLALGENLKKFTLLLADEVYYTFQYLRKRQGTYPGEVGKQFYFMAYKSFPIVCLITFLVGVTISLTSAAQLRLFGADIYLSWFVGIAMIRELVPLMTGVILAGKIGASVTAEISTMKVLEEIDALKTMGVIPEKFLMVPRLIAITLAIPLLVTVADFVGIFGGSLVAKIFLGTPPGSFIREMLNIVHFQDFWIGMAKTMVFGWAILISSGYKGFAVDRGAEEVGKATTESVVLSISLIILLDCLFAFLLY